MFSALRTAPVLRTFSRSFSMTPIRGRDMARLTLIGNLTRDPESRLTKNEKEYIVYTVVTQGPLPLPDANGERRPPTPTYHKVLSFNETSNKYLRGLRKGSKVYAEAAFEMREPDEGVDPTTPQGQRQIFLRHENIRLIFAPKSVQDPPLSEPLESSGF